MTRTVFVVDEDFDGRHALGDLLEDHGWEAVRLPGPREAVAALASVKPALVVTELWRPATPDGAAFAALLAETRRARSPLIVFTAWSPRAVTACLDIPVVSKPNVRMLLPLIEAALRPSPVAARTPRELNPRTAAALTPA